MKRFIVALLSALSTLAWGGETITADQAKRVAQNFIAAETSLDSTSVKVMIERGNLWIVSLEPNGYILVSVNRSALPVVAWETHNFIEPEADSPFATLLNDLNETVGKAKGDVYSAQWSRLLNESTAANRARTASVDLNVSIGPLLSSQWDQGAPYDDLSPVAEGSHMPDGCVATMYGQLMYYWQWPAVIDEDLTWTHMAVAWGYEQCLYAGTTLDWSAMQTSGISSERQRLETARTIQLAGMMAKMSYAPKASSAQNSDVVNNPWYTKAKGLDTKVDGSGNVTNQQDLCELAVESLQQDCPFTIGISNPEHSILGDGFKTTDGVQYIHLNFGWGAGYNMWYTMTYLVNDKQLSGFHACQRPKPQVLMAPTPRQSTAPFTLLWHFPPKGWETQLEGFTLHYAKVGTEMTTWTENFSEPQGVMSGEGLSIDTVEAMGNDTPALYVDPYSDRAYYTWPSLYVGEKAELSFRVRSEHSVGMVLHVQVYNQETGWETIASPKLAGASDALDWQPISVSLSAYANRALGIRIEVLRDSAQGASGSKAYGIQLDDFAVTKVHTTTAAESVTTDASARTYTFTAAQLETGATYLYTISPRFKDETIGIAAPGISVNIVGETPAKASISSITSVRSTDEQVQEGLWREGYFGLNQFAVYGSEATTGLVVRLSHPVLIDKTTPYFDTVTQADGLTAGPTSLVSLVSVGKVKNGKFLVKADFSTLSTYLSSTRLVMTFEATDELGSVARKDLVLILSKTGSETTFDFSDDEPLVDTEPQAPSDNGATRFCHGVSTTEGAYDVTRQTGYTNRLIPTSCNLILWWVDRYQEVHETAPSSYDASKIVANKNDGSYTIQSYADELIEASNLSQTLPSGSVREKYFPSVQYSASDWCGTGEQATWAKEAGKRIYAALANGPIGIRVPTSATYYYAAVIWGCDYAVDGEEKYATALYVTDTTTNKRSDQVVRFEFGLYTNGYGTLPGLKNFNGSGNNGVIEYYYPIVGPGETQTPDTPVTPDEPDDPVEPSADEAIGEASTTGDPGTSYTEEYGYEMYDNYWTARKRAIQQKKQLFILSGASWCSNCAFVKNYLKERGETFASKFVVYYSDHDSTECNVFRGGLPQYGTADPRTVDGFTGTLKDGARSWDTAWQTASNGLYEQARGGYSAENVERVINAAASHSVAAPKEFFIKGLETLAKGYSGEYELYVRFEDDVVMPVDKGVTWSLASGTGEVIDADVDGRNAAKLTITSDKVTLKATSSFYFTGSKSIVVTSTDLKNVASVSIETDSVNLEDDATPQISATATMSDGSTIPVVGFGTWSATFLERLPRNDEELEEENVTPDITIDDQSRLNYAETNGQLAVCDQKIKVTLDVNGQKCEKVITVWGPTKVVPSAWKMISGPRQTLHGVVRLQCTELKYNYGGEIKKTKDTYFASYKTELKFDSGKTVDSYLRGLTVISTSSLDENCQVSLATTKVNGKFSGYTTATRTETFTNIASGSAVTELEKGEVPTGFFKAFFPQETDLASLAEKDSDGDGFLNWQEYVLGTDPTDPSDGLTLLQGYQHLTAPAANGETMQYKVMYAQRAYRIYYIDAKVNWSDTWQQVAKVDLGSMEEDNVTTFTSLKAEYADSAKFFKVRAALVAHDFMDPTTEPQIAPDMLVAAPNSVIDLSTETKLPLVFSSFDTDATDPGTVYVQVPTGTKEGDVLIKAPACSSKSMAALKPQGLASGLKFSVKSTEDGKLALTIVSTTEEPLVEVDGSTVTVTVGTTTYDISAAFSKVEKSPDGIQTWTLDATPGKKIAVAGEEIAIQPELAKDEDETPFEVQDGKIVVRVKSIPGLKYQVLSSTSLESDSFMPAGDAREATSTRRELSVPHSGETKSFYKVQVSR